MSGVKDTSGNKISKRRTYLKDFQKDETGAYVYCGAVYDYEGSERSLHSLKVRLFALGALTFVALLLIGFIRVPGMDHSIYVLLPYVVALCGSVSVCWALGRFCVGGGSLREYVYQESIEKLPFRCVFTACCSIAALLGELAYIFINGIGTQGVGCIYFLILQSISIAATLFLRSLILRTKWQKRNETAAKSNTPQE